MTLTHHRMTDKIPAGYVILFSENGKSDHYGPYCWTLETELPSVEDAAELVQWTAEYYGVDASKAADLVNPSNIVDDAAAWDDPQYVSDLWQAMESGLIRESAGYRTQDGAVVIDRESVKMSCAKING